MPRTPRDEARMAEARAEQEVRERQWDPEDPLGYKGREGTIEPVTMGDYLRGEIFDLMDPSQGGGPEGAQISELDLLTLGAGALGPVGRGAGAMARGLGDDIAGAMSRTRGYRAPSRRRMTYHMDHPSTFDREKLRRIMRDGEDVAKTRTPPTAKKRTPSRYGDTNLGYKGKTRTPPTAKDFKGPGEEYTPRPRYGEGTIQGPVSPADERYRQRSKEWLGDYMKDRQGFFLRRDPSGVGRYTDYKRKPERDFAEYQEYGPGPERYGASETRKRQIADSSRRRERRKDNKPRGRTSRKRNVPENEKKNRTDTGMLSAAGGSTLIKELKDREQRLRGDDY